MTDPTQPIPPASEVPPAYAGKAPDWLKWGVAIATWLGGGMLLLPYPWAHQVGTVLLAIGGGSGVISRGTRPK